MPAHDVFALNRYIARRKILKIFGGTFTIYEPEYRDVVAYVRQKAFKLKEDIRIFTDSEMQEQLLVVRARQVIDFAASYDVTVPETGEKLGALRRKGFSSILRDRWHILDTEDRQVGEIVEDSGFKALLRRFLSNLIPQRFRIEFEGREVGRIRQFFNPFALKYDVDLTKDKEGLLDRRMALAAVILLLAVEGRQG